MQQITSKSPQFILASGSPRRDELTRQVGLLPIVIKGDVPEHKQPEESPQAYTERLALLKATDVAGKIQSDIELPAWILAADTIVVLDDDVLEKPVNPADAQRMLSQLSGRMHHVLTSFCWYNRHDKTQRVVTVSTEVHMRALSADTIKGYVQSGEPMDKAGSYGIQGLGAMLVDRIVGSYTCVVGLPVTKVITTLDELGGLGVYPFVELSS